MRRSLKMAWVIASRTLVLIGSLLFSVHVAIAVHSPWDTAEELRAWAPWLPGVSLLGKWSDAKAQHRLEKAIDLALADGRFWKEDVQTVDERFPGIYSDGLLPPYFQKITDDFRLGQKLGIVSPDVSLPRYSELSRNEHLALCPVVQGDFPRDAVYTLMRNTAFHIADDGTSGVGQPYSGSIILTLRYLLQGRRLDSRQPTQDEARQWLKEEAFHFAINPICNGLVNSRNSTFSRGQAYAEYIWDGSRRDELATKAQGAQTGISPDQLTTCAFFYYRIYGEKGTIAEGVRIDCELVDFARLEKDRQ